jgi:hypothetical protein
MGVVKSKWELIVDKAFAAVDLNPNFFCFTGFSRNTIIAFGLSYNPNLRCLGND